MMRKIALANQKGGVSKTTCAVNIAGGLGKLGKKTLVIDLDPQANLTYSLGIQAHELKKTVYELLKGESSLDEVIVKRGEIDVIPSNLDLSGAEIELSGIAGREFLLREILDGITGVEYVLIDCPPSLGLLTLNALTSATEVFIPLQTEFLALHGLSKLLQTVEIVQKRLNKDLKITGIIATRYDGRKKLNREVLEKIREHFKEEKLFETMIRENVSLAEAPSFGKTIFEYKPDSYGAEDYMKLCNEILRK